ncbi:extracellular solute-binding protein [Candidatus Uhrbacteria bacterium]|nr:extracellular solute-binding protein [Candidatus Uhrbacteria bacterium]
MNHKIKKLIAVMALVALSGQGCTKALPADTIRASQPVVLKVWSVVDDVDVYQEMITAYRVAHPNVQIDFRRFRLEEYKDQLLNALAEDRGPDVFLIHNTWTGEYLTKTVPMPRTIKTAYRAVTGTLKKELTWELRTEPTIALIDFKNQYADVVQHDLVRTIDVSTDTSKRDYQERIMGVPVGVDTMALYYNKDLLNAAGIPTPPENWAQFSDQVKLLTKVDSQGNVTQSAAGIGTADNVERATDLVSLLMIQNGQTMEDDIGFPLFHKVPPALTRDTPPSFQALEFYTDFANPSKDVYTWNSKMPNSLESFVSGRAAFFFGYAYQYDLIRARAPKLNLGLAKIPQIEGNPQKNFANYWNWVVAKKSTNQDLAWSFLMQLTQPDVLQKVLDKAKRPSARKSLLTAQLQDERVGVFAAQVLTATSWYRGKDSAAMERIFREMITAVVNGTTAVKAVRFAADQIALTIQ